MELVNLVLVSLRTKQTDAEFDKFWNQLISEVSQLDAEEPMLPRKMPKRFDEFASHHFYETPKYLYRRAYFEAYDNVIQGIEMRFQQKVFLIYKNIQDIFLNAINGKDSSQHLKVVCDVFKNDLNPTNLQVQLEQFANLFQDKRYCSIDTLVVLPTFGMNKSQKMLLPDVVKLARLFIVTPATNASSEKAFSGMKRIKTYLRNSTTNNRLNHCMVAHVHAEDVDKMNTIEIARDFIEYSQTRLRIFGRF